MVADCHNIWFAGGTLGWRIPRLYGTSRSLASINANTCVAKTAAFIAIGLGVPLGVFAASDLSSIIS